MVSRRNFITITMMLLILFFMFQFTGVMKDQLNKYGVNEYEMSAKSNLGAEDAYDAMNVHDSNTSRVYFIGETDSNLEKVAYWWCTYSKRAFFHCDSIEACTFTEKDMPNVIILDGCLVRTNAHIEQLKKWNESGINLVFARMPSTSMMTNSSALRDFLGVSQMIRSEVQLKGMHLFKGFLLGGEAIYEAQNAEEEELRQDMAVTIPWYVTGSGTKTYMVGMISDKTFHEALNVQIRLSYPSMDENTIENMILPAVIWRHGLEKASVFCVNGDFLEDSSGIGILEAMAGEATDYNIYPVVNAQNFVVADFPAFSAENETEMQRRYSQSASAVYKEIIWPSLSALTTRTRMQMTCMISPQFDYDVKGKLDGSNVEYYLKLFKEAHDEVGLSGTSCSQLGVGEKLAVDESFWKQYAPGYAFRSLYLRDNAQKETMTQKELQQFKTVVVGNEDKAAPLISFDESGVTEQLVTGNGIKHTFMDDFMLKSMETALAYSNITLDLYSVTYPESEDDSWEKMMKKISANVATFWKDYELFDQTTLSESDARIRRFLALDYEDCRQEDTIYVSIDHFEEQAYFLLRLNGENLKTVQGGGSVEIEEGCYLIEAQEPHIAIQVETSNTLHYRNVREQ